MSKYMFFSGGVCVIINVMRCEARVPFYDSKEHFEGFATICFMIKVHIIGGIARFNK
jgi:hypothetical protein